MRSKSIRSSAPPALRIPTFDSMKRFSTVSTEYGYEHTGSDIELPTFTFALDEGPPLILPNYLIDQIDAGGGIEQDRKTEDVSEIDWNDRSRGLEVLSGDFDHANKVNGIDGTFTNSSSIGDLDLHLHPNINSTTRNSVKTNIKHYTRHRLEPFQPQPRPVSQLTTHTVDSVGVTALPTLRSRGLPDTHHARFTVDTTAKMLSTPSKAEKRHKRKGSMMVLGEMLGALGRSLGKKSDGSDKGSNSNGKHEADRGNELKLKEFRRKRTGSTLSCMALGSGVSSKTDPASSPLALKATHAGSSGCHGGPQPFTPSTPLTQLTSPSTTSTISHFDTRTHTRTNGLKTSFVPVYPPSSAYSPNTPISTPRSTTTASKADPIPKSTYIAPSTSTSTSTHLSNSPDPNTPCPAPQRHQHSPSQSHFITPPVPSARLHRNYNPKGNLSSELNTHRNHNPKTNRNTNDNTDDNTKPNIHQNTDSNTNPLLPYSLDTTALPALQEIIQNLHAENERLRARLGVWK